MVKKFFEDKGFGFIEIEGKDCFFHKSSIRIRDRLPPRSKVVMKVIRDLVQGEQHIKASVVWFEADFEADEAPIKPVGRQKSQNRQPQWQPGAQRRWR